MDGTRRKSGDHTPQGLRSARSRIRHDEGFGGLGPRSPRSAGKQLPPLCSRPETLQRRGASPIKCFLLRRRRLVTCPGPGHGPDRQDEDAPPISMPAIPWSKDESSRPAAYGGHAAGRRREAGDGPTAPRGCGRRQSKFNAATKVRSPLRRAGRRLAPFEKLRCFEEPCDPARLRGCWPRIASVYAAGRFSRPGERNCLHPPRMDVVLRTGCAFGRPLKAERCAGRDPIEVSRAGLRHRCNYAKTVEIARALRLATRARACFPAGR